MYHSAKVLIIINIPWLKIYHFSIKCKLFSRMCFFPRIYGAFLYFDIQVAWIECHCGDEE